MEKTLQLLKLKLRPIKNSAARLKDSTLQLPLIRDVYGYFRFPRVRNGFRGVYQQYEQAIAAIGQHVPAGYDFTEHHSFRTEYLSSLNPSDRPMLPYLNNALETSRTVFDLGGSIGVGYYAYSKHVVYPANLKWKVCEVPTAVKFGRQIAAEKKISELSFTTDLKDAEGVDIYLTVGALQYVKSSLPEMIADLEKKPAHILVSQTPLYEGETYFTLQSFLTSVPPYKLGSILAYKIQNRAQFVAGITALGYELVDSWKSSRIGVIPFHPSRFVEGYHGFYFRRKE
jgi:putative methyltransferase (TIGR04325 family)